MKIKQYNFINGMVSSGKTILTIKLVSVLNRKVIYFDTELGSSNFQRMCGRLGVSLDRFVFFSGKSDFHSVRNAIRKLNEDCYESWDIVVDSVDRLSGSFSVFLSSLPANHRYFFTSTVRHQPYTYPLPRVPTEIERIGVLTDYQDRYLIPRGSVSVFHSSKRHFENLSESLYLYNYNTGEETNMGSLIQIFRNEKIKSILNETENQDS